MSVLLVTRLVYHNVSSKRESNAFQRALFFTNDLENTWHMFFDCPQAIQVWSEFGLCPYIQHKTLIVGINSLIFDLVQCLPHDVCNNSATLLWTIW